MVRRLYLALLVAAAAALHPASSPSGSTRLATGSHTCAINTRRSPYPVLQQSPSSKSAAQVVATPNDLPVLLRAEPALVFGGVLLFLLVGNRLFTDDLFNSQSRSDLIGALAPVLIILKALGDIDITPRTAEAVPLTGVAATSWLEPSLAEPVRDELSWAADALLDAIDSCAAVALWIAPRESADGGSDSDDTGSMRQGNGRTLLLRGTLPELPPDKGTAISAGPLLAKAAARKTGAPDYLPALQLLPGRVEFNFFPENSQGVLMLPLTGAAAPGALILAADRQRGFDESDTEWARSIASRVSEALAESRI